MPQPGLGMVHVSRPLTNISVAYLVDERSFIATRVFPRVPVMKKNDKYYTYPKAYWLRSEAQKRAPGTESAGSGWNMDTADYSCDAIAVHKDIDDQILFNADVPLNLEREATMWVTHQLLIKREVDWASRYFTTSTWTGSTTGGDITPAVLWNDAASTPIEDVSAQQIAIARATGRKPNKLVLGPEVYDALRNHPDLIDRIKHTQRGVMTPELMAQLFDVDEVLIPWAARNTAVEGATASMSFIFGKHALLVYAAPSPGLLQPSGGYTFTWDQYTGAGEQGMAISRFRMDHLRSTRVEGEMTYDMKVVAADVGAFFSSAVA